MSEQDATNAVKAEDQRVYATQALGKCKDKMLCVINYNVQLLILRECAVYLERVRETEGERERRRREVNQ